MAKRTKNLKEFEAEGEISGDNMVTNLPSTENSNTSNILSGIEKLSIMSVEELIDLYNTSLDKTNPDIVNAGFAAGELFKRGYEDTEDNRFRKIA